MMFAARASFARIVRNSALARAAGIKGGRGRACRFNI